MKKIYNQYFDETYFEETLENGLKVIVFHKPEFISTTCAFGTPYGALRVKELYNEQKYEFHPGVAHFLEHKLFEAKGDDMMTEFSRLGANVNAFTSYRETVYYFSKSGNDIEEPLNLLLDFVQELNITEESVEKEKGIIEQELSMYMQSPDSRLVQETYKAMYFNHPYIYDIGGDKNSVYKITRDELEKCYRMNYHPSNMALVITTPLDPEHIFDIVRNNQNNKAFVHEEMPEVYFDEEPYEVKTKEFTFSMDVNKNKQVYAFKIKPDFIDEKDIFKKEWGLRMLLEAQFSYLNPEYQRWLDEEIINDFFGYEIDFTSSAAYIMFYIENDDLTALKSLVDKSLQNIVLDNDKLNQIKRRYIGSSFDTLNYVENFDLGYIRDYLSGLDFFESIDVLKSITLDDVMSYFYEIDLNNYTIVSLVKDVENNQ